MTRTRKRTDTDVRWYVALSALLVLGCGAPADDGGEEAADMTSMPAEAEGADTLPSAVWGRAAPPAGETVGYFAGDEAAQGYLAVPEGEGPFPAVILIHEWNGLVDRIRQMADAMAAEGYVALAADLYSGRTGSNRDENMALVQEVQADPGQVIANLDAAARFLRSRGDVTGRIADDGMVLRGRHRPSATPSAAPSTRARRSSTGASSPIPPSSPRSATRSTGRSPRWTAAFRPRP